MAIQWTLGINEIFGTEKFCLLYQIFCYISSQKTIQNKENIFIGTGEISLLYQISLYRVSTVIHMRNKNNDLHSTSSTSPKATLQKL